MVSRAGEARKSAGLPGQGEQARVRYIARDSTGAGVWAQPVGGTTGTGELVQTGGGPPLLS